ncbi:site-specific integrase|uniref:Site-specific recombinase XerD n=1 Tax=Dendrosporobacter quercicolus TaxID=146817 RepID=A0A1G9LUY6_9FIRM|nr:site-specific integrase [Dendrosporobacter quercicolus]NSL46831.1 site-specific integrase [Dendrosporobacter quercicolus DSM 1736]SDL65541.1 Site-specific recombinase XerD [Dendrosporobacter quercicolus]
MANHDFVLRNSGLIEHNDKLSEKSKKRLRKSKAENTLRAYEADWLDFYDWCTHLGFQALPAEPETIVNYMNDLADNAKANTVSRRLSAISENHKAGGYQDDNPCRSGLVRNALDAIKREKGTIQRGKAPLLFEDLRDIASCFDTADIAGIRDKAIILTGFMGAFRRSELVKINVEDLAFTREGVIVLVHQSKGDQEGQGEYVAIPYNTDPGVCAVTALKHWLEQARLNSGPLFRPLNKYKKVRDRRLSDKSVALIVKKYAGLAGLNAEDFAGHSLRRGFATSAAQHDVDERAIMQQTRHKSEKMVRRYIEQGNLFKNNALNKMF